MANVKLKSFLALVRQRLFDTDGLGHTLKKYPQALQVPWIWAKSSRSRPESAAHPLGMRRDHSHSGLRNPRPNGRGNCSATLTSVL